MEIVLLWSFSFLVDLDYRGTHAGQIAITVARASSGVSFVPELWEREGFRRTESWPDGAGPA